MKTLLTEQQVRAIKDQCYKGKITRRCTKCVLPDNTPHITFNDDGVCDYCLAYEPPEQKGEEELLKILEPYRGKGEKYDCVVGISGGRDSAYTLYKMVRDYGMRVLAMNYTNPFSSDQAKENIKNMVESLNVDLVSFGLKKNAHEKSFKKSFTAWAKKPSPIGLDMICLACRLSAPMLFDQVKKHKIPLLVFGGHSTEVGTIKRRVKGMSMQAKWKDKYFLKFFYLGMKELAKNRRYINFTTLPMMFEAGLYLNKHSAYFKWRYSGINTVKFFDYVKWDEKVIHSTIQKELGWRKASDKASYARFDCDISYFKKCISLAFNGYSDKDDLFSKMIRDGLITREEALKRLHADNEMNLNIMERVFDTGGYSPSEARELRQVFEPRVVSR